MTDRSRIRFYLPAWSKAWARLRTIGPDYAFTRSESDHLLQQVLDIAARDQRPRQEALRHACHIVSLGRDVSSKRMTAADADRCVILFRLLADPLDLGAMMTWSNRPFRDRNRLKWAIDHSPHTPEYIAHISRAKFGTPDPEHLTDTQLHDLVRTLRNRKPSVHPVHDHQPSKTIESIA